MLNLKILYALGSATNTPQKVSIENVKISIDKQLRLLHSLLLYFLLLFIPVNFFYCLLTYLFQLQVECL